MFSAFGCSKEKRSGRAAGKMQDFVIHISDYARGYNKQFIVIPQNGVELAFNNNDVNDGLNEAYIDAINGVGVEELFYNGAYTGDAERLIMLQQIKTTKKVLVADYVANDQNIGDAFQRNEKEGFVSFPRSHDNYNYSIIPDSVHHANTSNIVTLGDARNYLYLISSEKYTSKASMLQAIAATNFDVVIMDLFFEGEAFTATEINSLKTKANGAKRLLIAYMNIGSAENFRYYWKNGWGLHHPLWLKKKYDGYQDEFWVKFWKDDWQHIIYGNDDSYCKKIINAGFDGLYLDNVEAYYFLYYDQ